MADSPPLAGSDLFRDQSGGDDNQNAATSSWVPSTQQSTMQLRHLQPRNSQYGSVQPDTEEHVESQTEDVFLNFVYQRFNNDSVNGTEDSTPVVPELTNFTEAPVTPAAEIGRRLASLGDDINVRYADVFDNMISSLRLGPSDDEAYDAFSCIGRRVLESGTNWSRIMFVLNFGYRIALTKLREHASNFASFLGRIVRFICRFFMLEKINKWIADHGGWRVALSYVPSMSTNGFVLISTLAALSVLAVFALHKYLS